MRPYFYPKIRPVAASSKPTDPSVHVAVEKAVTALRVQNEANENLDALKLSLKDEVDTLVRYDLLTHRRLAIGKKEKKPT